MTFLFATIIIVFYLTFKLQCEVEACCLCRLYSKRVNSHAIKILFSVVGLIALCLGVEFCAIYTLCAFSYLWLGLSG